jgi:single-strand DNA-binding protein
MATIVATGRVGKDAELRHLQDGTAVLGFSIADDIGWGEKKTTQWIQCALFGARAEKVAQYVTKGTVVEVSGTPTVEAWVKKGTSDPQAAIKIRVNELKLHGGKPADGKPRAANDADDDIPF